MNEFEVIESAKGNPQVLHDGYRYRRLKTKDDNTVYWACVKDKSMKCKGRLTTKEKLIINISTHICEPDIAGNEVKKQMCKAKKRAREESQPLSKIYEDEFQHLHNRGYEFVTKVPQYSSCKSSLYRSRSKVQALSSTIVNDRNIVLPEDLLQMPDGYNFLLFDNNEQDRILVFASENGREILSTSKTFFLDGTFKSVCKQFYQIYTFHADIGSTSSEIKVVPVLFALLPNKTKATYEILFRSVIEYVEKFDPQTVIMDFEVAAMSALRNVFPDVNIQGCNFHFNQCLWRKIQEIGLTHEYKSDDEIRLHLRMCASLSFLPVSLVDDGWLYIQENTSNNSKLRQFYDYFVDNWLENSVIDRSMWNCHKALHRTNNVVEGWHRRLNTMLDRKHPNILELIKRLKLEAQNSQVIYQRNFLNLEGKKRKTNTLKLDERIFRTLRELDDTGDLGKCLTALSFIHKFE